MNHKLFMKQGGAKPEFILEGESVDDVAAKFGLALQSTPKLAEGCDVYIQDEDGNTWLEDPGWSEGMPNPTFSPFDEMPDMTPCAICNSPGHPTEEHEEAIKPRHQTLEQMAGELQDDPGYRSCRCEDYPCCGH